MAIIKGRPRRSGAPSREPWIWILAWIAIVTAVSVAIAIVWWDWLTLKASEPPSATIRNIVLVAGAAMGLPLAVWRFIVAHRQAATSQLGLLNERYQKGAEMLGSEVPTVRLGGIYALDRLARERPEEYHIPILNLLCIFLRTETAKRVRKNAENVDIRDVAPPEVPVDVQEVSKAIFTRTDAQVAVEDDREYRLDLRGVILAGLHFPMYAKLYGADLRDADLGETKMIGASLAHADLSDANLYKASLAGSDLSHAKLTRVTWLDSELDGVNMSGAILKECRCLSQEQLDEAMAFDDKFPVMEDCEDRGEKLVWRGRSADKFLQRLREALGKKS